MEIEYEITDAGPVFVVRKPGERHALHRCVIDRGFDLKTVADRTTCWLSLATCMHETSALTASISSSGVMLPNFENVYRSRRSRNALAMRLRSTIPCTGKRDRLNTGTCVRSAIYGIDTAKNKELCLVAQEPTANPRWGVRGKRRHLPA